MLSIGIVNTDIAIFLNHAGLIILRFTALSAVKRNESKPALNAGFSN
jgi:hypothetical protein